LADQPAAEQLVTIVAQLREHCPWMGALTHASLVEYLLEEAYEVAEAIEDGHPDAELRGELGDVDVARGLGAKMIRRNPHVFKPDGSLQDSFPATVEEIELKWDAVKRAERPERLNAFEGIPDALPALAKAHKSLDRAARAGLGLPEGAPVPTSEDELGNLLLAVVRSARDSGMDAERALRAAVRRYQSDQADQNDPAAS
jgi:nucleoside triphosphate diphosphatase